MIDDQPYEMVHTSHTAFFIDGLRPLATGVDYELKVSVPGQGKLLFARACDMTNGCLPAIACAESVGYIALTREPFFK